MSQILDAAYPAWNPASLQAAGVPGVSRYLSWLPNSKVISKAEYDALVASGISVVLNWESSGTSWRYGYTQGVNEGREARAQARALGHPDDRPIIQSIDENLSPDQLSCALAYQRGFNDGGGCGPQGVYSTAFVIDAMFEQQLVVIGWQTNARGWYGNGPDSVHASILQRTTKSHPAFPPNSYDESDIVRSDWGQHPGPAAPPLPAPQPVPVPVKPQPITGGTTVDLTKTKTTIVSLAPKGFGLFEAAWETGATVAACWATTHGPAPATTGPDDWWEWSIEGQVRVQQRGTQVIITGFFPKWKQGEVAPQVHVFAIPT